MAFAGNWVVRKVYAWVSSRIHCPCGGYSTTSVVAYSWVAAECSGSLVSGASAAMGESPNERLLPSAVVPPCRGAGADVCCGVLGIFGSAGGN